MAERGNTSVTLGCYMSFQCAIEEVMFDEGVAGRYSTGIWPVCVCPGVCAYGGYHPEVKDAAARRQGLRQPFQLSHCGALPTARAVLLCD